MASGSRPAGAENSGNNEPNLVAEALATMQRRMADQDARIAEQMEEIRNLREQLNQHNDGGNRGNNDGNPSHMKGGGSHSQSGNNTATRQNTEEMHVPHVPAFQREPLYARFGKMKPAEFVGSTDPLEAE